MINHAYSLNDFLGGVLFMDLRDKSMRATAYAPWSIETPKNGS